VVRAEQASGPVKGVIVQLGGQTRSGWRGRLRPRGCRWWAPRPRPSTWPRTAPPFARVLEKSRADRAQIRNRHLSRGRGSRSPARSGTGAVRPSYVLGGRGMEIVYDDRHAAVLRLPGHRSGPGHPVLIDRFLDDAIEIDVDALYDGSELYLGGSWSTSRRRASIPATPPARCRRSPSAAATSPRSARPPRPSPPGVGVRGLLNVQYALAGGVLYVLEANPRASRTVPFVSKATAVPLAKAAGADHARVSHRISARRGNAAGRRRRRLACPGTRRWR